VWCGGGRRRAGASAVNNQLLAYVQLMNPNCWVLTGHSMLCWKNMWTASSACGSSSVGSKQEAVSDQGDRVKAQAAGDGRGAPAAASTRRAARASHPDST
jgi:hypothetical protein